MLMTGHRSTHPSHNPRACESDGVAAGWAPRSRAPLGGRPRLRLLLHLAGHHTGLEHAPHQLLTGESAGGARSADLAGSEAITTPHVAEALQYRQRGQG
jgi:hypothetical protein